MAGRRFFGAAGAAALLLVLAAGCGNDGAQEKGTALTMKKWHIDQQCDFERLETGLMNRNACSPVIDDATFQGIVIHAPATVLYRPGEPVEGSEAFADVRVCGTCCVSYSYLGLDGEVTAEILLVAVEAKTQQTWSGKMVPIRNPEPRPGNLGGEPVETEGMLIESYFNPNLVETLDLPETPAEYIVYAVLGQYKSNTVRIRVEKRS